jgi:hypothetical protein
MGKKIRGCKIKQLLLSTHNGSHVETEWMDGIKG